MNGLPRPLESKLQAPRQHVAVVVRRALLEALRRSQAPLVLVSAPAGAGKTTLLSQWAGDGGLPTAWLHLDEGDNDPVVLLAYLAAAIGRLLDLGREGVEWQQTPVAPAPAVIMPALLAALSAAKPFLLVIDDGQCLVSEPSWELLGDVFAALPPGARVGIGTRTDPPLPLARLRAAGELAEIGFDDLALDRDEMAQLLELNGLTGDDGVVDTLLETTEGWATGVYLSALCESLDGACTPPSETSGDRRAVARYLASEVLERQPLELQSFLLTTSILDRLSPDLCAGVTGRDDAHEVLRRLVRDNVFVGALGDNDRAYRYHHLFADFLQAELATRSPRDMPELHRRAAAWYTADGDVGRAVRHRLAAGEVSEAGDLVAANWSPAILRGHAATVDAWLRQFSDEQVLGHPPLTLAAGWYHAVCGDARAGELWRRASSNRDVDRPSPDGAASLRSSRAMLRSMLAREGVGEMRREAEVAASLETGSGSSWRATANLLLGRALLATGEPERAVQPLLVALDEGARHYVPMEMSALGYLALIAADDRHWDVAKAYMDRATECMTTYGFGEFCSSAHVHVAWARVRAEAGDPGVWDELDRARHVVENLDPLPFSVLQVSVLSGEICLQEGRPDEADRWLARAQATLDQWPDAGAFRDRAAALHANLERERGREPLSLAEERVLQLLPSQLSLGEIAERLVLTTNTVKTHVQRIYRKLGVNGRTAAVERARELGWLGH